MKTSLKGIIDRFEGDIAVIHLNDEAGTVVELPRAIIPTDSKEGSLIELKIVTKEDKAKKAKQIVQEMIDKNK